MKYQNLSKIRKTFRGVEFGPKEIKEVDGYINDPNMVLVNSDNTVTKRKNTSTTAASTTSSKSSKSEVK